MMMKKSLIAIAGLFCFVSVAQAQVFGNPFAPTYNIPAMTELGNALSAGLYHGVTPNGVPCRIEAGRVFLPNGRPFGPIRVAGFDAVAAASFAGNAGYFEIGPDPRIHSVLGYWTRPNGFDITVRAIGFTPVAGYQEWTGTITVGRDRFGISYVTLAESAFNPALGSAWTRQFACGRY